MTEHGKNMWIAPSFGLVPLPLALVIATGCGEKDDAQGPAQIAFFFNNEQAVL